MDGPTTSIEETGGRLSLASLADIVSFFFYIYSSRLSSIFDPLCRPATIYCLRAAHTTQTLLYPSSLKRNRKEFPLSKVSVGPTTNLGFRLSGFLVLLDQLPLYILVAHWCSLFSRCVVRLVLLRRAGYRKNIRTNIKASRILWI